MSQLHRRALGVLLALMTASALISLHPGGAGAAASTAPTAIQVTSTTSQVQAPAGTRPGAVPSVLVRGGVPADGNYAQYDVTMQLTLLPAGSTFTKDTALALTATATSGSVPLRVTSAVFPKGVTTTSVTTSVTVPANQVTITVAVAGRKPSGTAAGTSSTFDALADLNSTPSAADQSFTRGIGGSDGACADATPTAPVCGVAILPRGAYSDVFLSRGVCDAAYARCGSTKGSVVQVLADIDSGGQLYSAPAPFTVLMKCDKTLCGGGAIKNTIVNAALDAAAPMTALPACPSKGVVGPAQTTGCLDLVQSTRDNAGDTLLYVLLPADARVSIG